jgi:hypothetical protein
MNAPKLYAVHPHTGETIVIDLAPKELSLDALQVLVGGYIEIIALAGGAQLIVNEEGLPKRLPLNNRASRIVSQTILCPAVYLPSEWAVK